MQTHSFYFGDYIHIDVLIRMLKFILVSFIVLSELLNEVEISLKFEHFT